jgi:membrane-associated protease RseP (regulator of RpoE activity)
LFIGVWMSRITLFPTDVGGFELGEPLLFKFAAWLIWGAVPDGYTVNLHPIAFGAWFGLLATALNLFPIGQFDGGHISYAVLGRKSSQVTLVMIVGAALLTVFSLSWLVWTVIAIAMLFAFGRHHPRTFDEDVPLDMGRRRLALFAVVMFVLCFTPAPIEPLKLLR